MSAHIKKEMMAFAQKGELSVASPENICYFPQA